MKIQVSKVSVGGVEMNMAEGLEVEMAATHKAVTFRVPENEKVDPRIVQASMAKRNMEVEVFDAEGEVAFKSDESLIVTPKVHDGSFTVQGAWYRP